MTLAEIKRRVLRHLELPSDSDYFEAADLLDAINTARTSTWRDCGGPLGTVVTLPITAGQSDYPLTGVNNPEMVTAVAVRSEAGGYLRRIPRVAPDTLVQMQMLPVTGCTMPWVWSVRPNGGPGPMVSLYPTPINNIVDGLVIDAAGGAARLVLDADVSALPDPVEDAACWRAAADLALDYFDDESIQRKAPLLAARAERALNHAMWYVTDMDGGLPAIVPKDNFGRPHLADRPLWNTYTGSPAAGTLTSKTATSVNGETELVIDLDDGYPVAIGSTPMAFSWEQAYIAIATVAPDRESITVTLQGGLQFQGEDVTVYYEVGT